YPAQFGQGQPQIVVEARCNMLEAQRISLQTVHQDNAYTSKGVVIQLADGTPHHIAPGELLPVQWDPFLIPDIAQYAHGVSRAWGVVIAGQLRSLSCSAAIEAAKKEKRRA